MRLEFYSDSQKIDVFKLKSTALVIREITHVVLSSTMDDFNVSNKNDQDDKRPIFVEAGIFAEKKLFKAVINWEKSANSNFDLPYCSDFLEKLLKNETVEFDLNKAKVTTITQEPYLLGIKYFIEYRRCF
jgi:hypothetical protein